MRVTELLRLLSTCALLGCAPEPAPTSAPSTPPPPSPSFAPVVAAVSVTAPLAPAPPPAPPPLTASVHREIGGSIVALAFDAPPFQAAMSRDAVWMHDARGWHEEPLPASARGRSFALFYGRDHRVRVVARRGEDASARGLYLRWKPEGFREGREELGKLAEMKHPLVSVLGNDDPEIVCQPGDTCVVKRRSGWKFTSAPADLVEVTLGGDVGWAIAGRQLLRLGDVANAGVAGVWQPVGSPGEWRAVDGFFATRDRAWVVEAATDRVHAFDGTSWRVVASPIAKPRSIWGARPDALWLAGEGGLAFFDGTSWRPVVASPGPGPLTVVSGRGEDDVWVGGTDGLFRVETRGEPSPENEGRSSKQRGPEGFGEPGGWVRRVHHPD